LSLTTYSAFGPMVAWKSKHVVSGKNAFEQNLGKREE
jgi:hypothetical protein